MRASGELVKYFTAVVAVALACGAASKGRSVPVSARYQAVGPSDLPGVQNIDEQQGPFAIGEQNYNVLLHVKRLAAATDPLFAQTLAGLEIRDASGSVAYEKSFPYAAAAGRLQPSVSATVERVVGNTGAGLMIHYT